MITEQDILNSVEGLKANGAKAPYEIFLSSKLADGFSAIDGESILILNGCTKILPSGEKGKHFATLGEIKIFKPA